MPTTTQTILTDTRTITNTQASLALTVGECERVEQIGEERPPDNKSRFYICSVTLRATSQTAVSEFSEQMLGITERSEMENNADWFPPGVYVSDALGSGTLPPGSSTTGRIAGLVSKDGGLGNNSDPVLVWQQAGLRIIMRLEP